jgi:hypothetical protein
MMDNPGPGAYELKPTVGAQYGSTPVTIKPRRPIVHTQSDLPGPGAYDLKAMVGVGNKYTIRHRTTELTYMNDVPGPGRYDERRAIARDQKLQSTMGSRTTNGHNRTSNMEAPAPNTYNVQKPPGTGQPKFSIGGRLKSHKTSDDAPGPGAYNVHDKLDAPTGDRKKRAAKFTLGARLDPYKKNGTTGPGPASYDIRPMIGRQAMAKSIGQSKRSSVHRHDTPGPGTYSLKNTVGGLGTMMSTVTPRRFYKPQGATPGPAEYNPLKPLGTSAKKMTVHTRYRGGPGDMMHLGDSSPGPQAYKLKPAIGNDSLKMSISSRKRAVLDESYKNPGPSHYNLPVRDKTQAPSFSFSSVNVRTKVVDELNVTPGPGAYNKSGGERKNPDKVRGVKWRAQTSIKFANQAPGPGSYNIKPRFGLQASSKSIGCRFYDQWDQPRNQQKKKRRPKKAKAAAGE